jgi:hypothetical protein
MSDRQLFNGVIRDDHDYYVLNRCAFTANLKWELKIKEKDRIPFVSDLYITCIYFEHAIKKKLIEKELYVKSRIWSRFPHFKIETEEDDMQCNQVIFLHCKKLFLL